ncbi:MAG: adenosylcobinamide kinase [Clostridia bacterium]|nr:adenosylcobinamide kinase [Clostridia bacterium]
MTALYIGGAGQGKYALARRIHGAEAPIVDALHERVRDILAQGGEPMELLPTLQDQIVLCDEVGCGVVPLERGERDWREAVGRLCCALAARADLVVRVTAGLPQVLKGELP